MLEEDSGVSVRSDDGLGLSDCTDEQIASLPSTVKNGRTCWLRTSRLRKEVQRGQRAKAVLDLKARGGA